VRELQFHLNKLQREKLSEGQGSAAEAFCVAREGIFAQGAKTNLSMCLKPRERLSLGRFAERLRSCLSLAAAAVPCENGPFCFLFRPNGKGRARAA